MVALGKQKQKLNIARIGWEQFIKIGKPVKFQSRELIESRVDMRLSFSLNNLFHSSCEKQIIETNNEITIAIINSNFYSMGVPLTWLDCKIQ